MGLKDFLRLVEIQTKVASQMPLLCGTVIALWLYGAFDWVNWIIFALSLLCIDMMTTALNNYMDFKKAHDTEGYGYRKHNAIVNDNLPLRSVELIIGGLFTTAVFLGLWLVTRTDLWVLLMGSVAFLIGIAYTFGPVPLSRTPFGEVVSGVTMGFGILFITVYIQLPEPDWLTVGFIEGGRVIIDLAWWEIFQLGCFSVPLVVGIGNIMFANNMCDREEDFNNHRFTLPISIGQIWSGRLFVAAYVGMYIFVGAEILLGLMPWGMSLFLLTALPVVSNAVKLVKTPVKATHFKLAVVNFMMLSSVYLLGFVLVLWFK